MRSSASMGMLPSAATVRKRVRAGVATGVSAMGERILWPNASGRRIGVASGAYAVPARAARLRLLVPARPRHARRVQDGVVVLHRPSRYRRRQTIRLRADVLPRWRRTAGNRSENALGFAQSVARALC